MFAADQLLIYHKYHHLRANGYFFWPRWSKSGAVGVEKLAYWKAGALQSLILQANLKTEANYQQ